GGRYRCADVERAQGGVDREELTDPARDLQEDGEGRADRRPHDAEPLPGHRGEPTCRTDGVESVHVRVWPARARKRKGEETGADSDEDEQARDRPGGDLRRPDDVEDEDQHGNEIEHAMREDGADESRPQTTSARELAVQDGDTRELA